MTREPLVFDLNLPGKDVVRLRELRAPELEQQESGLALAEDGTFALEILDEQGHTQHLLDIRGLLQRLESIQPGLITHFLKSRQTYTPETLQAELERLHLSVTRLVEKAERRADDRYWGSLARTFFEGELLPRVSAMSTALGGGSMEYAGARNPDRQSVLQFSAWFDHEIATRNWRFRSLPAA
jgi:hypothetical protein